MGWGVSDGAPRNPILNLDESHLAVDLRALASDLRAKIGDEVEHDPGDIVRDTGEFGAKLQ